MTEESRFRHARFRKSSRSANGGSCVEVAGAPDAVGVRDSKDAAGSVLEFSRAQWSAFVAGLKRSM
jgi:hypothetical protein